MRIKLYDNENYEYPIIQIKDFGYDDFKKDLKEYQQQEEYNIDDFILLIETKYYYIDHINYDEEVFF